MEYVDLHEEQKEAEETFTADTPQNEFLFSPYGTKNSFKVKSEGGVILSPSGLTKFFNNPEEWYDDRFGVPTFAGNTNTVLGNAVHASIESIYKTGNPLTRDEVEWWMLQKYSMNPDVDSTVVLKEFEAMVSAWTTRFYASNKKADAIEVEVELLEHSAEKDGGTRDIWTMGTADAIFGGTLVDWKTCGSKPRGIGNYKYQLMQYARAFKKTGQYDIDTIKIVYIQRPTKTIGPRIHVFEEKITSKDWIEAEYFAELQVNSLLLADSNPDIKSLIFRPNPISMW